MIISGVAMGCAGCARNKGPRRSEGALAASRVNYLIFTFYYEFTMI